MTVNRGSIVAGTLLVAMSSGCASPPARSRDASVPTAVSTSPVKKVDLPSVFEAGGVVRASATAPIASRLAATIVAVHVRPGDRVRRGARLVTLDARDGEANNRHSVAAALAAAESATAAEADVRAAESAVTLARATHGRITTLVAQRSATAQELDQSAASLSSAEAQAQAARARLAASAAARDAAAAAVESTRIAMTYAAIVAPFDGVVVERHAEPGMLASPGVPLVIIEDPSTFKLEVALDAARGAPVSVGRAAEVKFDGSGESWVAGRVSEVARIDPASHNFLVKIDLPPAAATKSGVFGRARFAGSSRRTLAVPRAALVTRGQLTFVYVVDSGQRARLRPVSTGAQDGMTAEILAGLTEGEVVVIAPAATLVDGARVLGASQ